jgi:hypothetical protein
LTKYRNDKKLGQSKRTQAMLAQFNVSSRGKLTFESAEAVHESSSPTKLKETGVVPKAEKPKITDFEV